MHCLRSCDRKKVACWKGASPLYYVCKSLCIQAPFAIFCHTRFRMFKRSNGHLLLIFIHFSLREFPYVLHSNLIFNKEGELSSVKRVKFWATQIHTSTLKKDIIIIDLFFLSELPGVVQKCPLDLENVPLTHRGFNLFTGAFQPRQVVILQCVFLGKFYLQLLALVSWVLRYIPTIHTEHTSANCRLRSWAHIL